MAGPTLPFSQELHSVKYREPHEEFTCYAHRVAVALTEDDIQRHKFEHILVNQYFLPAGRIQRGAGSQKAVTLFNCFVLPNVPDSTVGIMDTAKEAALTMRMGGGVGYNFSLLRPSGALIKTLGSPSTGPLAWMNVYDALCHCIASAGHRRGAQMGILRVDHPDIEAFIESKQNLTKLLGFNLSVSITDEFMEAVSKGTEFALRFEGVIHRYVDAQEIWEKIMRSTWDWAEPGVIFHDTMNRMNNLYYCETLDATNPCAEQPLPPYGACLLGSLNLPKFLVKPVGGVGPWSFDMDYLLRCIPVIVRAMDRVTDISEYPLPEQRAEAFSKRRMGIGITGLANCIEAMGHPYGSPEFVAIQHEIESTITAECYRQSALLAKEKGSFPLYDEEKYLKGEFIKTLPEDVLNMIRKYGIRNSHLRSNAPTGTISMTADNISSGVEPVFNYGFDRDIFMPGGKRTEFVEDYGSRVFGVKGKTASEVTVKEHLSVLLTSQRNVDSSVSKTVNHDNTLPWSDFNDLYMQAWLGGAKGCATFNSDGKRAGLLRNTVEEAEEVVAEAETLACYMDPLTGQRSCG